MTFVPHRDVRATWQGSDQSRRALLLEDAYEAVGFEEHWFALELLRTHWNDLPIDVRRAILIWDGKRRVAIFQALEGEDFPAPDTIEWEPTVEDLTLPPPRTRWYWMWRQVREFVMYCWEGICYRFQKS